MTPISELAEAVRNAFPQARVTVSSENWLDIRIDDRLVTVTWKSGHGFVIKEIDEDTVLDDAPDFSGTDPREVTNEVFTRLRGKRRS